MAEKNKSTTSIGIGTILFSIFLVFKLAGIGEVANWSWWWVTSPLWIPAALVLVIVAIVLVVKSLN